MLLLNLAPLVGMFLMVAGLAIVTGLPGRKLPEKIAFTFFTIGALLHVGSVLFWMNLSVIESLQTLENFLR